MGAGTKTNLLLCSSVGSKVSLEQLYEDLSGIVKEEHPEHFIPKLDMCISYNPASKNIVDSYRSVMHFMMLKNFNGLEENPLAHAVDKVSKILDEFGIKNDDGRDLKITKKINDLIDERYLKTQISR